MMLNLTTYKRSEDEDELLIYSFKKERLQKNILRTLARYKESP